jgi:hypothetical protein
MSNTNQNKDKLSQANQGIDKAQDEAKAIQSQGIQSYLFERKISMKLVWFLSSLAGAFLAGVILAW